MQNSTGPELSADNIEAITTVAAWLNRMTDTAAKNIAHLEETLGSANVATRVYVLAYEANQSEQRDGGYPLWLGWSSKKKRIVIVSGRQSKTKGYFEPDHSKATVWAESPQEFKLATYGAVPKLLQELRRMMEAQKLYFEETVVLADEQE